MLTLNGAYGEGGGQILRSALTLATITGEAIRLEEIRAGRRRPGLRPQHLTAVHAAAAVCGADVEGAELDSQTLRFVPQHPPQAGDYFFDVAHVAPHGSAGAVTLVLQTLLLPLALSDGNSTVVLRGGTTVPSSPPADYVEQVYLPTLFDMGVRARLTHRRWGFAPEGGGELVLEVKGRAQLRPLNLMVRGELVRVTGTAFAAGLPSHIPQRMVSRAYTLMREAGFEAQLEPRHVVSSNVGTGLFLCAGYEFARAGFLTLGRIGLPSEEVAELTCDALFAHHRTGAALDRHLADQLVLPFGLAASADYGTGGASWASVSQLTPHLYTALWVAQQFGLDVRVTGELDGPGTLEAGTEDA